MGVRPLEYFSLCAPSAARVFVLPLDRGAGRAADNVTGKGGAILVTGMAARDRSGDPKGNWRFLEGCMRLAVDAGIYIQLSLRSTAQPLDTTFAMIFSSCFSKVTIEFIPRWMARRWRS
jgi:hypothetical protein